MRKNTIVAVLCTAIVLFSILSVLAINRSYTKYPIFPSELRNENGTADQLIDQERFYQLHGARAEAVEVFGIDEYDILPNDTPDAAVLRGIEHRVPEETSEDKKVEVVHYDDGFKVELLSGFDIFDFDEYTDPYIYGSEQNENADNGSIVKKVNELETAIDKTMIRKEYWFKSYVKKIKDEKSSNVCTSHSYAEDGYLSRKTSGRISGSQYHVELRLPVYLCENCGKEKFGDYSYDLIPHTFDGWYLMPDTDEHIGSLHRFVYFSHCNVCRQYCWKIVYIPCGGNGGCVTAKEYIEGDFDAGDWQAAAGE